MMTIRIFLAIFLAIFTIKSLQSQPKKNRLEVYYIPQITKTYFEQILENNPGSFKGFYETVEPNRPLLGYSTGIGYARILKHLELGIFIKKNLRGQRSDFAYNYRGLIPTDTLPDYGGLYYHFKMKSVTFGLTIGKAIHLNDVYYSSLYLGIGLDVYQIAFLEDFIIKSDDGLLRGGCCRHEYEHYPDNQLTNILRHIKNGYYRAEFSLAWRNEIKFYKNIHVDIQPQVFFLTKILKDARGLNTFVPDGIILAAGLQLGLNYHL